VPSSARARAEVIEADERRRLVEIDDAPDDSVHHLYSLAAHDLFIVGIHERQL
jgi:hypothetical protein